MRVNQTGTLETYNIIIKGHNMYVAYRIHSHIFHATHTYTHTHIHTHTIIYRENNKMLAYLGCVKEQFGFVQ